MEDLEGGEPQVEETTTQPEVEPTVGRTFTEEDFRKEVDTGIGKGLSSINKQLSTQRTDADKAKAEAIELKVSFEALERDYQTLQEEEGKLASEKFAEDPAARQAYLDKGAIREKGRELAKKTAEAERKLYAAEKLNWEYSMTKRADELNKETGISIDQLSVCQTEEEMEVKALRFKLNKEPEAPEPTKPKIVALGPSGAAPSKPTVEQMDAMSAEDYSNLLSVKERYK